jgi:hypothetical protein
MTLRHNKAQISQMMSRFIWSFHVGDNIAYNFKVVFALYEDKARSSDPDIYNKPLIVQMVSILECLMYDFVVRLEQATNQWPAQIPMEKRARIKARLTSETVKVDVEYSDQTATIQRVRNYSFDQLLNIFEEFELFGPSGHSIYTRLKDAGRLRNRIHIFNWFGNYEARESETYSNAKLAEIELLLDAFLRFMSTKYPRSDSPIGIDAWVAHMS